MKKIRHLPYAIDPEKNRNHYYETLWKVKALELLAKHKTDLMGWNLLDYGSGRGETLLLASQMGMRPKGTDLDPECVRLSSAYGEAVVLDLTDPVNQLGRKAYDVVTCFHVLEHVPSPVQTLGHLTQMARCYVLLAVPNGRMMPDLLRPHRNVDSINEGHLQNWDHSHLLNLAERHCGLKLVEWTFDHVKLPILSNQICRFLGQKAAIFFETKIFKRLFPYQSTSIIGLFEVVGDAGGQETT
jgi:2-polyprenyl-3-methyl-5-hydroxy-6-metoxy-1,4-benzoquinol methylase